MWRHVKIWFSCEKNNTGVFCRKTRNSKTNESILSRSPTNQYRISEEFSYQNPSKIKPPALYFHVKSSSTLVRTLYFGDLYVTSKIRRNRFFSFENPHFFFGAWRQFLQILFLFPTDSCLFIKEPRRISWKRSPSVLFVVFELVVQWIYISVHTGAGWLYICEWDYLRTTNSVLGHFFPNVLLSSGGIWDGEIDFLR